MSEEGRICEDCRTPFDLEAQDLQFYRKIAVPLPTFCPQCRLRRRLAFINILNLYKRPCGLCKREVVSMYDPDAPYQVYCPRCWWSDNWDPLAYGRDYDFSRPFFEQLNELWHEVPLLGLSIDLQTAESSPYNNHCGHLKNCYLLFHADFSEDCAYGFYVFHGKSMFDSSLFLLCESTYDTLHAYKVHHAVGSQDLIESLDCAFMRDSENCQNCFASANLRNKKYCIFNQPYSREGYFEELKKWDLGSYAAYEKTRKLAREHWRKFPPMPRYEKFAVNCTGNRIYESKNCKECFEAAGAEDSKYLFMVYGAPNKDCYDFSSWGNNTNLMYECSVVGENCANVRFCQESGLNLYNAEYCKLSTGGSNHFGCVSIKKGDYVIMNKRYSESEFHRLREKIIAHMNERPYVSEIRDQKSEVRRIAYKYGEFFPPEMSPSPYNGTIAENFFPLSREEIEARGLRFRELDSREYAVTKRAEDLPDHIKDAPQSIVQEVIGCSTCPRGFKIIPMELDFLKRMNLPLPRRCPFCRIGEKFAFWVKEMRLVKRTCDSCSSEFETPHAPEDAPRLLCKACYLKEVV